MQFTVIEVRLIPLPLVKEIPNLSSKKHTNLYKIITKILTVIHNNK